MSSEYQMNKRKQGFISIEETLEVTSSNEDQIGLLLSTMK